MASKRLFEGIERRFRTSPASRQATIIGVNSSATVSETSGTGETRQQWAPASRNAVELVQGWDTVLSAIDPDLDDLRDETILESFQHIQNELPQCKLGPEGSYTPFQPDAYTKILIFLSAYASKSAYGTAPIAESPYLEHNSLELVSKQTFEPSFDGSVKQLELRVLSSSITDQKTIFVAVRGSAPMVDWLINFNGDDVEAPFLFSESEDDQDSIRAHRGFLGVTQKMEPAVTHATRDLLRGGEHIVITGHSAGGGVAALLFLHYTARRTFGDTKLSCITFAAPPTVSLRHTPRTLPNNSVFLSIINEDDPVPRADKSYIMSFANLYAEYKSNAAALSQWTPPVPTLHMPQESKLVMLRPSQDEEMQVTVHEIERDQLEQTVAMNPDAHKMDFYLEELRIWGEG